MERSKKRLLIQGATCVILLCLVWGMYYLVNRKIVTDKQQKICLFDDDFSWIYQVDNAEQKGKKLVLEGFAFEAGVTSEDEKFEIVLHNLDSGENIFSQMEYVDRQDVNDYFFCKYDYSKSGFIATFESKNLSLKNQKYEVLLRVLGEERAYRTGTFISNEKIVFFSPLEFMPPDVVGTDLEEIVNSGVLRIYRPDYGMYVYQYNGDLYWIADPRYDFNDDGEAYIQWHLETSQVEKLPQYRLENQWYFDNLGFYFSEEELKEWNTGKYRVARMELPMEYSITRMNTGCHEEGWIWKEDFRPFYDLQ